MHAKALIQASAKHAAFALVAFCAACSQQPAQTASTCAPATEDEVQEAFTAWTEAYNARDIEGVMAIFDRTVLFEFQGAPDSHYSELEAAFRAEFAQPAAEGARWIAEPDTIMLSGEMANVISTWRQQVRGAEGGVEIRQTNRAIDVLQRGADCRWRITRSLNYPLTRAEN
jgi:uncharacterized protein (TIGR02246 family)